MRPDPNLDERLTPAEKALYSRIYPLIKEIEDDLGVSISRLVAVNMVRRAVTQGSDLDEVIKELRLHGEHQAAYNAAHHHHH
jgi:hypothetical protein